MKESELNSTNVVPSRLGRWAVLVCVLFVIALVAGLIPRWRHEKELKRDTAELAVPTVNVVAAVPGKPQTGLTLPAEVRPFVEAPIYARANGYLTKWYVDLGAKVDAGALLAEIDTPDLDQELIAAQAGLAQAQAAYALAKVTADRWAELMKTSSVSEQENAEKGADLKLKEANVDAAKATVQRFQDLKAFTRVVAPFAGTVTARDIDMGDLITSGKELFRLADTRTLRIYVRVPQSAMPGVAVGGEADITVPEIAGRNFPAKVVRTAGAMDANSRTLLTELDVDNGKSELTAGSYAQVTFHDLNRVAALTLPSNTLLFRSEGPEVGVVHADGQVELRHVMLGRDFGSAMEVLSGISAGERVILNPSDSLVDGAKVRLNEAAPGPVAER
ncbi:MAG TPA: efflux RND transporter periplasmic adaptor subunit [Verrucomicrobiae bacterium]|nr:efflux RND transporter periplasmic adaptor subunit [Verrucomicrobiae bacterium]